MVLTDETKFFCANLNCLNTIGGKDNLFSPEVRGTIIGTIDNNPNSKLVRCLLLLGHEKSSAALFLLV